MVEWGIQPEYMQEGLQALGLLSLAMAFRADIKKEVRRRQGKTCDCCGEDVAHCLQIHHREMESRGGSSTKIENAVGLGGERDCACHQQIDLETMSGQIYPQVHTKDKYYPQGEGLNE